MDAPCPRLIVDLRRAGGAVAAARRRVLAKMTGERKILPLADQSLLPSVDQVEFR